MIALPTYSPVQICFVCDEYPPALHGGIGSQIQSLARALVADGHRVRVIGTHTHVRKAPDYEEDHGVKVWRLAPPRYRRAWPLARWNLYRKIASWARNGQIDVVEVVDFAGPAAYWPKLPVPVIARLHGSATYFASELKRKLRRHDYWIERASLCRADYVCSISKYAAERTEQLFQLSGRPIEVLHDFIDGPLLSASTPRCDQNVVFSGTLTRKKGVIELFQGWPDVVARHPQARLHVYGKDCRTDAGGSMKEALIAHLDSSIRHTVRFHGHTTREELFAALSRARVGVFPSYSETFGLGPVESMAAGCPTIYGRCGCASEIMRDGIDGLLVQPGDSQAVSAAINRVLSDPILAGRLSSGGRKRVQQCFSAEAMVHQNEDYYRYCIKQFRRQSARAKRNSAADRLAEIIRQDQLARFRRQQRQSIPTFARTPAG